jgi:hypothetical protein
VDNDAVPNRRGNKINLMNLVRLKLTSVPNVAEREMKSLDVDYTDNMNLVVL